VVARPGRRDASYGAQRVGTPRDGEVKQAMLENEMQRLFELEPEPDPEHRCWFIAAESPHPELYEPPRMCRSSHGRGFLG
jgi:hypothetical protein